jgi:NAD(P)-dependent dehydrogenase (short-subunit alcohol dehydrogenase family)
VTILGRRREPLEAVAAKAPGAGIITADVTDEKQLATAFVEAAELRGAISIVVANAGAAESAPFARTSREQFERMLAVNLTGTFLTLREGLKAMQDSDWGRLVAIASVAGLKGYPYVASYTAAKHGVVGLVRALAAEIAGCGITANTVCPAYTESPMLEYAVRNVVEKTGRTDREAREILSGKNPLKRFIKPEEVAAAVLYLCGAHSEAVNGQALSISGGETW